MDAPASSPGSGTKPEEDDDDGPSVSGPAPDEKTTSNPLFGKKVHPPTKKTWYTYGEGYVWSNG